MATKVLEICSQRPMVMRLERPATPQCDMEFHELIVYPQFMELVQHTEIFSSPHNTLKSGMRKWQDMVYNGLNPLAKPEGKLSQWSIQVYNMLYTFHGLLPEQSHYSAIDQTITTFARIGFDAYDVKEV